LSVEPEEECANSISLSVPNPRLPEILIKLHVPRVVHRKIAESGSFAVFLSVQIRTRGMKAFSPIFKTLYDTGMGPGSGMSEGLGPGFGELKSLAKAIGKMSSNPATQELDAGLNSLKKVMKALYSAQKPKSSRAQVA
jgi:hypothetical protein